MSGDSVNEIEHRYILSGFPEGMDDRAYSIASVKQVYFATGKISERFSRRKYLKDEKKEVGTKVYRRTVKIGHGLHRLEFKDKASLEIYRQMKEVSWARKIHKVRYRARQNLSELKEFTDYTKQIDLAKCLKEDQGITDFIWEVDRFKDRDLFLAEVEVPWEECPVVIPEWLAPYVIREVTDESQYEGVALAK